MKGWKWWAGVNDSRRKEVDGYGGAIEHESGE